MWQNNSSPLLVSIGLFFTRVHSSGVDLWVQQRKTPGPFYDLWEFPGGKIEKNESAEACLIREIEEETGVHLPINDESGRKLFKIIPYFLGERQILLHCFLVQATPQIVHDLEARGKWISFNKNQKSAFLQGEIPSINHAIIDEVIEFLTETFNQNCGEIVWS